MGKSTVGDVKKKEIVLAYRKKTVEMGMSRNLRLGENQEDHEAYTIYMYIYIYFKWNRMEGVPNSGPMLSDVSFFYIATAKQSLNSCMTQFAYAFMESKWFCIHDGL